MESAGMTGVCLGLKPQNIEDITAIIALYRPGPMDSIPRFIANKHNPAQITYKHPSLEPILANTYGCIVYQEQVFQIFQQLAGYSLGQADMVRRAMSKKKAEGHPAGAGGLRPRGPGPKHHRMRGQRHPRGGGRVHLRRDQRLRPTTPSTRPTRPVTRWWPIRPPGSSATTPGVL